MKLKKTKDNKNGKKPQRKLKKKHVNEWNWKKKGKNLKEKKTKR